MKVKIHRDYIDETHRVFPELNTEVDYPYFCPQCDENFYEFEVEEAEADENVAHRVESSNGFLLLDKDGNVLYQETAPSCSKLIWFDLDEYEKFWGAGAGFDIDILDLRGIFADGKELIWTGYREKVKGN